MKKTIFFLTALLVLPAFSIQAQTLTLDSCLVLARRNNAELRTSQMEIAQAREVKRQVFAKYFPQVSLSGIGYWATDPIIRFGLDDIQSTNMRDLLTAIYELVSPVTDLRNELSLMKHGASGAAVVAQPIYAGGRIATGNQLAQLGIEAAELQAEVKERDVLEEVESTFYLVAGLQQKEATVAAALALIDSLDRTVQAALANGLVTRSDALQLQLKRNEMLANKQQLASGIRLSKRLLCSQIGIDYSDKLQFADPLFENPPLPSFTHSPVGDTLRPESRLLQLAVDAERLQRRLTLGATLPQLTVLGTAYYGNLIKNEPSANLIGLLSLSVPLTAWGETSHKLKQHDIRIAEAQLKQDHLSRMMSLEEEKAYSDMVDAAMLMKSDSAALKVAEENYRLSTLNYQAGVITLNDVLQAHTLLLQAQNAITDRRTTYIAARRRLTDLRHER